jgi:hypothetical protein
MTENKENKNIVTFNSIVSIWKAILVGAVLLFSHYKMITEMSIFVSVIAIVVVLQSGLLAPIKTIEEMKK